MQRVLFTDFDGVLHRIHAPDELTIATAGIGELQEGRPDLFGWAGHLMETLEGHRCDLAVHSSWRAYLSESDLRSLLPAPLRERFIGTTTRDEGREASILRAMRTMQLDPENILILDDEPFMFSALKRRVVTCHPHRGLSDDAVKNAVRAWLTT